MSNNNRLKNIEKKDAYRKKSGSRVKRQRELLRRWLAFFCAAAILLTVAGAPGAVRADSVDDTQRLKYEDVEKAVDEEENSGNSVNENADTANTSSPDHSEIAESSQSSSMNSGNKGNASTGKEGTQTYNSNELSGDKAFQAEPLQAVPVTEEEDNSVHADSTNDVNDSSENTITGSLYLHTLSASSDNYTVTVKADEDAKIPKNTELVVREIADDTDEYQDAKDAVVKEKKDDKDFDEDNMGMTALDISLMTSKGAFEPQAPVQVKIEMNSVPENADHSTLEVQHIKKEERGFLFFKHEVQKVETVADAGDETNGSIETSEDGVESNFVVGSFSIFTITWNTTKDSKTYRFANVRIHYVSETGLTISDPATVPASVTFGDGTDGSTNNILTLSDWANEINGSSRVSGYNYLEARIGDKDGKVITGLKGVKSSSGDLNSYKLYYTTSSIVDKDSDWKVCSDNISGSEENNANVYLVYTKGMVAPITVHYLDSSGNPLKDVTGSEITRVFNIASLKARTGSNGFTDMAKMDDGFLIHINGYAFDTNKVNAGTYNIYAGTTDSNAEWNFTKTESNKYSSNASFKKAVKGSVNGDTFRFIRYDADNHRILVARSNGNEPYCVTDQNNNNVNFDIYITYSRISSGSSKIFTVHYAYITKDNTEGITDKVSQTFNLEAGKSQDLRSDSTSANAIVPANVTKDGGTTRLTYMATRLGSIQGPDVREVLVTSDDSIQYHTNLEYTMPKQRGADRWYLSAPTGRNFTIVKSGEDYTLTDSQHGSIALNLAQDNQWTAVYHGENQTTKYTVTISPNEGRCLNVEDWTPSVNTDIYAVYIDDNTDQDKDGKLWIEDDLKYSGYFIVGMSDTLKNAIKDVTPKYTWYRRNGSGDWEEVTRRSDFTHYNVEYDADKRTWLDVEADMGSNVWTAGDDIQYKVVISYTKDSSAKTIESAPLHVDYYGRLENGSFEVPVTVDYTDDVGNEIKGARDSQGNLIFSGSQTSNAKYKAAGGVWQTTGVGTEKKQGQDIEVFNTSQVGGLARFWFDGTSGYEITGSTSRDRHAKAADGMQFAELNCETAGALYQDVITHPNEQLSYWLSHRARMNSTTDRGFDSMYLVIMPTKLAMTSASDGGELKTQEDLKKFINSHGGYDESTASAEENRVTYRDEDNGILIRKVSSGVTGWHDINETADYLAKGGLTRFFFATGKSHINDTTGNFLDNVGFSQAPQTPEGFSLTIQKTFTNLTPAQVDSMAASFRITLSDEHINSMTGVVDGGQANAALNGAVLGFTSSVNGGVYTFTPTAMQGEYNLITGTSTATARIINGNVVMTWTLDDQKLDAEDQYYNYKATESGATVDGYRLTDRQTVSPEALADTNAVTIHQNETGRITINNTYTPHGETEEPQLTVRKVFAGVTPRQVDSLFSHGYKITVVGPNTSNSTVSYDLSTNTDQMDATILLDESINKDGSTVLKWTIPEMKAGDYKVTESGLEANQSDNKLTKVTVNGDDIGLPATLTNDTELTKDNVTVGSADGPQNLFDFGSLSELKTITTGSSVTTSDNTNLIIARYEVTTTESEVTTTDHKYLVWTSDTLGIKSSDAVINEIKELWKLDTKPEENDVYFRSGANPGSMTMTINGGAKVKVTYDGQDHSLTFADPTDLTAGTSIQWDRYYSTHYRVKSGLGNTYNWEDDADITIENLYNPIVRIQKISMDGASLGNAKFRLYKLVGGTKQYYLAESSVAQPEFGAVNDVEQHTSTVRVDAGGSGASVNEALAFTTSDSTDTGTGTVLGMIEVGALEKASGDNSDTYYLEEVTAPNGYNKLIKPVSFTVDQEGTIVLGAASDDVDNTNATVDYQSDARYYIIRISNSAGAVLPETGGPGVWPFIFTGMALTIFAAYLLWCTKRDKRSFGEMR